MTPTERIEIGNIRDSHLEDPEGFIDELWDCESEERIEEYLVEMYDIHDLARGLIRHTKEILELQKELENYKL